MLSIGVEGLSVTPAFAPEFKMTFRVGPSGEPTQRAPLLAHTQLQ